MNDQNKNNSSAGFNPIGLCMGMGVGLCFGVALDNMGAGIALGMSIGLCFSVALGRKSDTDDKPEKKSGDEEE